MWVTVRDVYRAGSCQERLQKYGQGVGTHFPQFASLYALVGLIGFVGLGVGVAGLSAHAWALLPSWAQQGLGRLHAALGTGGLWVCVGVGGTALAVEILLLGPLCVGKGAKAFTEAHTSESAFSWAITGRLSIYVREEWVEKEEAPFWKRHIASRLVYATLIPISLVTSLIDIGVGLLAAPLVVGTGAQHRGSRQVFSTHLGYGVLSVLADPAAFFIKTLNPQAEFDTESSVGEQLISGEETPLKQPSIREQMGGCVVDGIALLGALPIALAKGGSSPRANRTVLLGLTAPFLPLVGLAHACKPCD